MITKRPEDGKEKEEGKREEKEGMKGRRKRGRGIRKERFGSFIMSFIINLVLQV